MIDHLTPGSYHYIMPFFDQAPPPGAIVAGRPQPVDPPLFFQSNNRFFHFSTTTHTVLGKVAPRVIAGAGPSGKTFRWLPYVAGLITYLPLAGGPILTGKFTGCWMAVFTLRGVACVAHIGTDNMSRSNTEDVKNAWKIAKGRGIIREMGAFNPVRETSGTTILGAIAADQSMYAIACDEPSTSLLKVKTVKRVFGTPSPQFL